MLIDVPRTANFRSVLAIVLVAAFCCARFPNLGAQELDEERIAFEQDGEEEEDGEPLRELQFRIEKAKREAGVLKRMSANNELRQSIMQKVRRLHRSMREGEERIERAEERDDEVEVQRIVESLQRVEVDLEQSHYLLDLRSEESELLGVMFDLNRDEVHEHIEPLEELLKLLHKRISLVPKIFDAYRNDDEQRGIELEGDMEFLTGEFELLGEIAALKRELHWMREEGETDEAEEVERELRALQRELRLLRDEPNEPEENEQVLRNNPLAQPVALTKQEVNAFSRADFASQVLPTLRSACFDCHSEAEAAGDLNLESLVAVEPLVAGRKEWINVIEQLKNRSMPPSDHDQPSEEDRRLLVGWLTHAIIDFDYSQVQHVGFEPARRLTHDEYNHTVSDLFGIVMRPADRFPEDMTASSGFDNSSNSLFLQPLLMERYANAATRIADAVVGDPSFLARWRRSGKGDAKNALAKLMSRAYRRKVTSEELTAMLARYEHTLASADEATALRDVIEILLVSPNFLIRTERVGHPSEPFSVTDIELASRLSYFLWASMPDDRLYRLGVDGTLSKPDVLAAEIDRMLDDRRSRSLGELFASQWLGFADLGRLRPDQIDNPWATDALIEAMHDESSLFFSSLVEEDASIEQLVDAKYTFLNEELARHYGIDGISGKRMRRVDVELPRGGLFGQGSLLAITSFPGRTSPVLRGNWVLSELLGTPPPPPPPNVSEFDEAISESRRLSQKQKLEMHRRNPNCYACHSQIDPLGFSLSKFDWFGRYRPRDRGREVDDTGQFPDGTTLKGIEGLRKAIAQERIDDLTIQMVRKMLSYALGRQLEYYDEASVAQIVAKTNEDDRKIRTMIREIVLSDTFQMKQTQPAK